MEDRWLSSSSGPEDRLAALRTPDHPDRRGEQHRRKTGVTRELILGVILLLVGACVVLVLFARGSTPVPTVSEVSQASAPPAAGFVEAGKALVPAFVETGDFPPELSLGDNVLVVVLPHQSSDGVARVLQQHVSVAGLSSDTTNRTGAVITLLGPENLARDIADAERVHLSIVSGVEK